MDHSGNTLNFTSIILTIAGFVILLFIYMFIYKRLKTYALKTSNQWDNIILDIFKIPLFWILVWIELKSFTFAFLKEFAVFKYVTHISNILLIILVAWILTKLMQLLAFGLQKKLNIDIPDNLEARKRLTQLKVFQNISLSVIVIIALALILMTFDEAKIVGQSLLASAGIAGIIVGFAAQKSIGMFLAGIQLAITQPIRLDDVVVVEGEWGRIEEITLTYVVVKIWDERRLVLPVNYFLEKPFQNWTRMSADILGTVFIYVGYDFPIEALRNYVPKILHDNPNWDRRIFNVQVTNTTEFYKELRILVSSSDASKNWDLRTEVREKVIDFIQINYPDSFTKVRLNSINNFQVKDG